MTEPRFYVIEHAGYPIADPPAETRGSHKATAVAKTAEVMVLDRRVCHKVVWSSWGGLTDVGKRACGDPNQLAAARRRATAMAERLNTAETA